MPSYSWMYYVGNPDYASANQNFVPNQVLVEALKAYRDNRLFAYCDLNGYKGDREGDPDSFDSYFGVPFGLASPDAVYDIAAFCCSVDARYCEPQATYGIITTARTLLVEAEAATIGWIDADADALYQAGIRASFAFSGADGVDAYLQNPKVIRSVFWQDSLPMVSKPGPTGGGITFRNCPSSPDRPMSVLRFILIGCSIPMPTSNTT